MAAPSTLVIYGVLLQADNTWSEEMELWSGPFEGYDEAHTVESSGRHAWRIKTYELLDASGRVVTAAEYPNRWPPMKPSGVLPVTIRRPQA